MQSFRAVAGAGGTMNLRLNPLTAVTILIFLLLLAFLFCLLQPAEAQPFTTTPTATIEPVIDPIWLYEAYLPIVMKGK